MWVPFVINDATGNRFGNTPNNVRPARSGTSVCTFEYQRVVGSGPYLERFWIIRITLVIGKEEIIVTRGASGFGFAVRVVDVVLVTLGHSTLDTFSMTFLRVCGALEVDYPPIW